MDPFITIHHPKLRLEASQRESTFDAVWKDRGWKRGDLPKRKPKPRPKKTTDNDT